MTQQPHHNSKRILIAIGFQPFPTLFGGAVDVWERIVGLVQLGHVVDIVFTEKKTPFSEDLLYIQSIVNRVFVAHRNIHWSQIFRKNPMQVVSRQSLQEIPFDTAYDLVIAEGEFAAQVLQNPSLRYQKFVLRVHNNEGFYYAQLKKSATSWIDKIYYTLESPKIDTYCKKIQSQADRLWYISADEWKNTPYPEKAVFLPVPINEAFRSFSAVKNHSVLFVGSLFMPNNLYALDWYLRHVHPVFLEDPLYQLIIVGAVKSKEEQHFIEKKYENTPKVRLYFNQKELMSFYEQSCVFINPMFHGSGVKIKSVMAMVNALPLVSTNVGAEGMGITDEMFWRANTKESFIEALQTIFHCNENTLASKVNAAQKHLQSHFYLDILERELRGL